MKDTDQNNYECLLLSLQHFHSVVGMAFPLAVTKIAGTTTQALAADQEGSRVFIPTKLFVECEKTALSAQDAVEKLDLTDLKHPVQSCWTEVLNLLQRVKQAGRQGDICSINRAFVLLCLTSGVLQHFISSKTEIVVPHTPQFRKVEPLEKLLELCGRSDLKSEPVEKILDKIIAECKNSLTS
jgi:hypothetical protein